MAKLLGILIVALLTVYAAIFVLYFGLFTPAQVSQFFPLINRIIVGLSLAISLFTALYLIYRQQKKPEGNKLPKAPEGKDKDKVPK